MIRGPECVRGYVAAAASLALAIVVLQASPSGAVTQPPPGTTITVTASAHDEWVDEAPLLYRQEETLSETITATVTADGLVGTAVGENYRAASYPSNDFHPVACSSFTRFRYSTALAGDGLRLSAFDDGTWELSVGNVPIGAFTDLEDAPDCEYIYWDVPDPADQLTWFGTGALSLQDSDPDPGRFAADVTFGPSNPVDWTGMHYPDWSLRVQVESAPLQPERPEEKPGDALDQCPMRPGVQSVECRATWVRLKKTQRGVKVTPNPRTAKVLVNFGPVDGKGKKRFRKCSGACFVKLPNGQWWFNAQIRDSPRFLKSRAGIRPVRIGR